MEPPIVQSFTPGFFSLVSFWVLHVAYHSLFKFVAIAVYDIKTFYLSISNLMIFELLSFGCYAKSCWQYSIQVIMTFVFISLLQISRSWVTDCIWPLLALPIFLDQKLEAQVASLIRWGFSFIFSPTLVVLWQFLSKWCKESACAGNRIRSWFAKIPWEKENATIPVF